MGNHPTYYWLWDMDASMFVSCEELDHISQYSAPMILSETNQLCAFSRVGPSEHMRRYYEWHYGQLVLETTIYTHTFEHPEGMPRSNSSDDRIFAHRFVKHELRDGEMVLTEDYCYVLRDESLIDDIISLLHIKRKPNRKVLPESIEKCGSLDLGLSHEEITNRLCGEQ